MAEEDAGKGPARQRVSSRRDGAGLFFVEEEVADVRPELLRDVVQCGGFYLIPPIDQGLVGIPLLGRVVGIGQSCF